MAIQCKLLAFMKKKEQSMILEIFKRSGLHLLKDILLIGDKGYQVLKLYY